MSVYDFEKGLQEQDSSEDEFAFLFDDEIKSDHDEIKSDYDERKNGYEVIKDMASKLSDKYIYSENALFDGLCYNSFSDFSDSDDSDFDDEDFFDYDEVFDDVFDEEEPLNFAISNEAEIADGIDAEDDVVGDFSLNDILLELKTSLVDLCEKFDDYGDSVYCIDGIREDFREINEYIGNLMFFNTSDKTDFTALMVDLYHLESSFNAMLNGGLVVNENDFEDGKLVQHIYVSNQDIESYFESRIDTIKSDFEDENPGLKVNVTIEWDALEGDLFDGDPSTEDFEEGEYGDSDIISDLYEVVSKDQEIIRNMIFHNPDKNRITVKFFDGNDKLQYVSVSDDIPRIRLEATDDAGDVVNSLELEDAFLHGANWIKHFEKAYAASGLNGDIKKAIYGEKEKNEDKVRYMKKIYGEPLLYMCESIAKTANFYGKSRYSKEFNKLRMQCSILISAIKDEEITLEVFRSELSRLFIIAKSYTDYCDEYPRRFIGIERVKACNRYYASDYLVNLHNLFLSNEKMGTGNMRPIDSAKIKEAVLTFTSDASFAKTATVKGFKARLKSMEDVKTAKERRKLIMKISRTLNETKNTFEKYLESGDTNIYTYAIYTGSFLYFDELEAKMEELDTDELKNAIDKTSIVKGTNANKKDILSFLKMNILTRDEITEFLLSSDYPAKSFKEIQQKLNR